MWNLASKAIDVFTNQQKPATDQPALMPGPVPPTAMPPGNPQLLPDWQRFILANKGQLLGFARRGLDADFCAEMAIEKQDS